MDRRAHTVTVLIGLAALAGCGSGSPSTKQDPPRGSGEERRYEESFRPSEFDPPPAVMLRERQPGTADTNIQANPSPVETPSEYLSGFRVQIFSSTDIDEANGLKSAAEQRFPEEAFYVVYEPPTYKVRAGDFQQRYDADRLARTLREAGYSDSWIVPDRVVKTPPVKTPESPDPKDQQK